MEDEKVCDATTTATDRKCLNDFVEISVQQIDRSPTPKIKSLNMDRSEAERRLSQKLSTARVFETFCIFSANSETNLRHSASKNLVFIDTRSPPEYESYHVFGAINIPTKHLTSLDAISQVLDEKHPRWGPLFKYSHHYHIVVYGNSQSLSYPEHNGKLPGAIDSFIEERDRETTFAKFLLLKAETEKIITSYPMTAATANFFRSARVLKGGIREFSTRFSKECTSLPEMLYEKALDMSSNINLGGKILQSATLKEDPYNVNSVYQYSMVGGRYKWGDSISLLSAVTSLDSFIRDLGVVCVIDMCEHRVDIPLREDMRHIHYGTGNHIEKGSFGTELKTRGQLFKERLGSIVSEILRVEPPCSVYIVSENAYGLSFAVIVAVLMRVHQKSLLDILAELAEEIPFVNGITFEPNVFCALAEYEVYLQTLINKNTSDLKNQSVCSSSFHPKTWYLPMYYDGGMLLHRQPKKSTPGCLIC